MQEVTYTIKDIKERTTTIDHLRVLDQFCGREASTTSEAFTTLRWDWDPSASAGMEPATGVSALGSGVVILFLLVNSLTDDVWLKVQKLSHVSR